MNVIKMISLPGGYNGLYIKIDHRLMDSCGAIVMVNDIMELYCHYKFGTPYPEDMASFTDMVERDLKKKHRRKTCLKRPHVLAKCAGGKWRTYIKNL